MITIDQAKFFANLQLTQAYCEQELRCQQKSGVAILRSSINLAFEDGKWFASMPSSSIATSNEQRIPWEEWAKKSDPYYLEFFIELFNKQLEFKALVSVEFGHGENYQGRILVVEHGENIPDGAAEPETDGFFDEWDLPPIDTWFYNDYSPTRGGILFAWIPEKFIELADIAIEIQFLNILHWFEKPSSWNTYSADAIG